MNRWPRSLLLAVAIAIVAPLTAAGAKAEKCSLQLKRISSTGSDDVPASELLSTLQYLIRPQSVFLEIPGKGPRRMPLNADFAKIVKKEPAKYASAHPLRGVVQLGSEKYAFALDFKDDKSEDYIRLHFDLNHNGDLTDDKVIEGKVQSRRSFGTTCQFPRVDLTIDVDGSKIDYAFLFSIYSQATGDFKYASVSLTAAAYREGDVTLGGKKRHLLLLDLNSNGRFDDVITIPKGVEAASGRISPNMGDLLLIDPDPNTPAYSYRSATDGNCQQYVSKLISLDDHFYNLRVSPAGDEVAITPSSVPVGYVTSPHEGFRGALCGDQGFVRIHPEKSKPAPVPQGEWRLLSYKIDRTGWKEPPKKPDDKAKDKKDEAKDEAKDEEPQGSSLLGALFDALTGGHGRGPSGPRPTIVSAEATPKCPAIKVRQGETISLPFGPPYKPEIEVYPGRTAETVQLQLSLVGVAGEKCDDLEINGSRPAAPKFTIRNSKGEVAAQGTFNYG